MMTAEAGVALVPQPLSPSVCDSVQYCRFVGGFGIRSRDSWYVEMNPISRVSFCGRCVVSLLKL